MVVLDVSNSIGVANSGVASKVKDGGRRSCFRGSANGKFRGRQLVTCSDVVLAYGDAEQEPWTEVLNLRERPGKRKAEGKPHATLPDAWTTALSQHMAWTRAKELSMLNFIDQPCNFAWPVMWSSDHVDVGGPHPEYRLGLDLTDQPRMPEMMSRTEAEAYFTKPSLNYDHFGLVPSHLAGGPLEDAMPTLGSSSSGVATDGSASGSLPKPACAMRDCSWYDQFLDDHLDGKLDPASGPGATVPLCKALRNKKPRLCCYRAAW